MTGSRFLVWLLKKNIGRGPEVEDDSALILSERLGGHALAIEHMAGIMNKPKLPIGDFTAMYSKSPRALHQRGEIEALFKFSFQSLDEESRSLLGVISYFLPDGIHQEIFTCTSNHQVPAELSFCEDEVT